MIECSLILTLSTFSKYSKTPNILPSSAIYGCLLLTNSSPPSPAYICVSELSQNFSIQYSDVIMGTMASQITSVSIVYSTICSGTDQRKHQSSVSLAFLREIHRWLVNSPHKGPVRTKMFPCDEDIMQSISLLCHVPSLFFILYCNITGSKCISAEFYIPWHYSLM